MANERLQGKEQFHSKNYLLKMLCSIANEIVAANVYAWSGIVTHCKVASFLIKTILCEADNIFFSKNY